MWPSYLYSLSLLRCRAHNCEIPHDNIPHSIIEVRLCSLKQPLPSNQRQQTLLNLILSDIVFIVQIATIITPITAPSLLPLAAAQHYLHKVSFVSTSWEKAVHPHQSEGVGLCLGFQTLFSRIEHI